MDGFVLTAFTGNRVNRFSPKQKNKKNGQIEKNAEIITSSPKPNNNPPRFGQYKPSRPSESQNSKIQDMSSQAIQKIDRAIDRAKELRKDADAWDSWAKSIKKEAVSLSYKVASLELEIKGHYSLADKLDRERANSLRKARDYEKSAETEKLDANLDSDDAADAYQAYQDREAARLRANANQRRKNANDYERWASNSRTEAQAYKDSAIGWRHEAARQEKKISELRFQMQRKNETVEDYQRRAQSNYSQADDLHREAEHLLSLVKWLDEQATSSKSKSDSDDFTPTLGKRSSTMPQETPLKRTPERRYSAPYSTSRKKDSDHSIHRRDSVKSGASAFQSKFEDMRLNEESEDEFVFTTKTAKQSPRKPPTTGERPKVTRANSTPIHQSKGSFSNKRSEQDTFSAASQPEDSESDTGRFEAHQKTSARHAQRKLARPLGRGQQRAKTEPFDTPASSSQPRRPSMPNPNGYAFWIDENMAEEPISFATSPDQTPLPDSKPFRRDITEVSPDSETLKKGYASVLNGEYPKISLLGRDGVKEVKHKKTYELLNGYKHSTTNHSATNNMESLREEPIGEESPESPLPNSTPKEKGDNPPPTRGGEHKIPGAKQENYSERAERFKAGYTNLKNRTAHTDSSSVKASGATAPSCKKPDQTSDRKRLAIEERMQKTADQYRYKYQDARVKKPLDTNVLFDAIENGYFDLAITVLKRVPHFLTLQKEIVVSKKEHRWSRPVVVIKKVSPAEVMKMPDVAQQLRTPEGQEFAAFLNQMLKDSDEAEIKRRENARKMQEQIGEAGQGVESNKDKAKEELNAPLVEYPVDYPIAAVLKKEHELKNTIMKELLATGVSDTKIKKQYFILAHKYHPDRITDADKTDAYKVEMQAKKFQLLGDCKATIDDLKTKGEKSEFTKERIEQGYRNAQKHLEGQIAAAQFSINPYISSRPTPNYQMWIYQLREQVRQQGIENVEWQLQREKIGCNIDGVPKPLDWGILDIKLEILKLIKARKI